MIGSLLYCCCKPVRIATCLDLSTVDQPSRVVTLLLCFIDVVWVVRFHRVHVSYFKKLCSNFIINRNHFWTGGLHPGSCGSVEDSAGVKCTQWLFWWWTGCDMVSTLWTQWAPSRLKKIRQARLLVASVYSHWLYGLWLRWVCCGEPGPGS
jgi:hypothetical protein